MNVVVVGAGIAGLATAWRLAQRGARVEVLDRGIAGRGATWASAGMLAPGAEFAHETSAIAALAKDAYARWPAFAAELEAASGSRIGYRQTGSLVVAENEQRAGMLQSLSAERGCAVWLSRQEMLKREPMLSRALYGALHVPGDRQADNRVLGDALYHALSHMKVSVRENCAVRSIAVADRAVRGVVTVSGLVPADTVILACGAWTNLIGGVLAGDVPPVRPAKGQMAALDPPPGIALPNHLIWSEDVYLVPRDGRLFIGATVEDAVSDTSVTREARDWLIAAAVQLVPLLVNWTVAEMWAGLRPRTPDDAPVLGPTAIAGLYVAGGQFRNGILFAPAIAEAICDAVLESKMDSAFQAFDPRRFSTH